MYLIPIYARQINENSHSRVYQCWVLLERNGTAVLEIPSVEAANEFAAENEITLQGSARVAGEFVILPVDPIHTALQNFYTWSEVAPGDLPMREVWRPFLWIIGKDGSDVWGTNSMLTIQLGGVAIRDVLDAYFRTLG